MAVSKWPKEKKERKSHHPALSAHLGCYCGDQESVGKPHAQPAYKKHSRHIKSNSPSLFRLLFLSLFLSLSAVRIDSLSQARWPGHVIVFPSHPEIQPKASPPMAATIIISRRRQVAPLPNWSATCMHRPERN
jgi:hypothetical protein